MYLQDYFLFNLLINKFIRNNFKLSFKILFLVSREIFLCIGLTKIPKFFTNSLLVQ